MKRLEFMAKGSLKYLCIAAVNNVFLHLGDITVLYT